MNIIQTGFIIIRSLFFLLILKEIKIKSFLSVSKSSCAPGALPAVTNGYVVPGNRFPLFFFFFFPQQLSPLLSLTAPSDYFIDLYPNRPFH